MQFINYLHVLNFVFQDFTIRADNKRWILKLFFC